MPGRSRSRSSYCQTVLGASHAIRARHYRRRGGESRRRCPGGVGVGGAPPVAMPSGLRHARAPAPPRTTRVTSRCSCASTGRRRTATS
jgi:hypothetical protein